MNPLKIDYVTDRSAKSLRFALIGAAALSAWTVVHSEWHASAPVGNVAGVVEAVRPRTDAGGTPRASLEDEVREAERVMAQLTMPWTGLFSALEKAHIEDVALLALQPDAERKALQITGEAKAFEVVLAYVGRLKSEGHFDNVHLVSTEVRTDHPQRPVGFSVSASWAGVQ